MNDDKWCSVRGLLFGLVLQAVSMSNGGRFLMAVAFFLFFFLSFFLQICLSCAVKEIIKHTDVLWFCVCGLTTKIGSAFVNLTL